MSWDNTPIIDSIQLPGSNTKYFIADAEARNKIDAVVSATHFVGVTTTELIDGATTNPITIDGKRYTAQTGDIVIYTPLTGSSLEFIWDSSKWQMLGGQAIEGLGDLAYKNTARADYTPSGYVSLGLQDYGSGGFIGVVTGVSTATLGIALCDAGHDSDDTIYVLTEVDGDTSDFVKSILTSTIAAGSKTDAGSLPTLTGVTANGLTASISNTTLVFGIGDGNVNVNYSFNSGVFPTYNFASVTNIENISRSKAMTNVNCNGAYITGMFTGQLDVDVSEVTTNFTGYSSTITVS